MQPDLRLGTTAATVANRHCGTGISPDRDNTAPRRDVVEPCASLPTTLSADGPHTRGNRGLFHERRRNPPRRGLSAGENWIRNFSSALPLVVSRVSEIRDPRRGAGRIGVRFASPQEGADSNSG